MNTRIGSEINVSRGFVTEQQWWRSPIGQRCQRTSQSKQLPFTRAEPSAIVAEL